MYVGAAHLVGMMTSIYWRLALRKVERHVPMISVQRMGKCAACCKRATCPWDNTYALGTQSEGAKRRRRKGSLVNRNGHAAWAEGDNSQLPRRVEIGLRYEIELNC